MKNLLTFCASLLILSLVLSSCGDDEKSVPNRLVIDGESFKLTKGYIAGYGPEQDDNGETGSIYEILLTTESVDFSSGAGLEGEGQIIDLILFSGSTVELAEGTYQYDDDFFESTLIDGVAFDANFDTMVGDTYSLAGGSITVSKSGNTWTFNWELVMEDGLGDEVEVTGSFSGMLTEMD
ncbi:hypothetical protein QQ054_25490 [Oscillatoria amoena NRMC-F 0135]|nr:hypothetical protein [Oscillatoria amoena NRMC-F 0135]